MLSSLVISELMEKSDKIQSSLSYLALIIARPGRRNVLF